MSRKKEAQDKEKEQEGMRKGFRKNAASKLSTEKESREASRRGNRQIMLLTYFICLVFLGMAVYLVWFMVTQSQTVINNPYNTRQEALAQKVQRGSILSADGKTLAETITDSQGNDTRYYPYNDMFCHVVGRTQNSMTGVELSECYPLLTSHASPLKQLTFLLRGQKVPGDTVVTTLNYDLQEAAYNALGNQKGAVVALEPSTGKVLAMVSKPGYDPNTVETEWDSLVSDDSQDSALLNRATQGLYPPGSTFKVVTAMEYLREHKEEDITFSYTCTGSDSFSGNAIQCYGGESHGSVDLQTALSKSCNTAFAQIGTTLDTSSFRHFAKKLMFNQSLSVDFAYSKSQFNLSKKSDVGQMTQTAIGQGETLITPLENAMIAAMIANDGEMMLPYVVDYTENDAGRLVKNFEGTSQGQVVQKRIARQVGQMMCSVVTEGTATSLSHFSYSVAGKTGSAEADENGTTHAWFIGYAPADDPQIAVSIIIEGAGTGSRYAVPVAEKLFSAYLGS